MDAERNVQRLTAQLNAVQPSGSVDVGLATPDNVSVESLSTTSGPLAGTMFSRLNNPKAQELLGLQAQLQIGRQYGALFRQLALSAEQESQLKKLLTLKLMAPTDLLAAAGQEGVTDPQEYRKLLRDEQSALDDQIKQNLGADNYSKLQSYQDNIGQRAMVSQLQQLLAGSPTPLTEAQSTQLINIFAITILHLAIPRLEVEFADTYQMKLLFSRRPFFLLPNSRS